MPDPDESSSSYDKLEDVLSRLTKQQLYLGESVNAMTLKIEELLHRVSPIVPPPPTTHPDILALTTQFSSLFQTPTALPPS